MKIAYIRWLSALLAMISIFSLTVSADQVDDFILEKIKDSKIPGLQIAVIQDNKIIKIASYGIANLQDNIPVTENTVFTLNSITKLLPASRLCSWSKKAN